jgi:putative Mg2+ transporter-C (MgtC) family protein
MLENFWNWTGDIHPFMPQFWASVVVSIASVVCGGLIGWDRERAQKPAGLRTLILICLGSAIFTQASILIVNGAAPGDRGRIAAQVVSGIGFLGAGAIIQEGGLLIGVTTGAGIWATAAVGVVLGAGYVAAGGFFTLLIVGTLSVARVVERFASGPCRFEKLHITFEPAEGKTRLQIQAILDENQHEGKVIFQEPVSGLQEGAIWYCAAHRDHHAFLGPMMSLRQITRASQG